MKLRWTEEKMKDPSTAYLSDAWYDIWDNDGKCWYTTDQKVIDYHTELDQRELADIIRFMNMDHNIYAQHMFYFTLPF